MNWINMHARRCRRRVQPKNTDIMKRPLPTATYHVHICETIFGRVAFKVHWVGIRVSFRWTVPATTVIFIAQMRTVEIWFLQSLVDLVVDCT